MSTGPLGLTWVSVNPLAKPRGDSQAAAANDAQAPASPTPSASTPTSSDQSFVPSGQGLLLEWAGSSSLSSSSKSSSALDIEWATSSNPATQTWGGGSSTSPPSSGGGLDIEWRTGSSTPLGGGGSPPSTSNPATGSNPLGLTWVGGSSNAAPPPTVDPEAQRLAQIKAQLTSPLPPLPGPAQGANWKQNDLVNRANVIKAIRSDPALQAAFENWDKLPMDAQLTAANRVSAIQGQIYGFQPAAVQVDAFLKKPSYGYYHPTEDRVHVSPDVLGDLREFLNTVTHEQAHAYQWEKAVDAKKGKMAPSDPLYETALAWYDNYFNYVQPADGYEAYRTQPIEAHAFATGDGIVAGVFAR